jgi:hypothetical protein
MTKSEPAADRISCFVGSLCLLLLLIVWVSWSGSRQTSFLTFTLRAVTVLVSWLLAIAVSVWGFRTRSFKLKVLNVIVIVAASVLGLLDGFSLL